MDELIRQKSPNWKVKVYLLNDTGNWDDCGTGTLEISRLSKNGEENEYFQVTRQDDNTVTHPTVVSSERLQKLKSENTNQKVILYLPISKTFQFDKQGDSIISWVDKNLNEEIAISFLDTNAANETWRAICLRTGKSPVEAKKYQYDDLDQLIMPTLNNIPKIKKEFEEKKDWMIGAISKQSAFLDELNKVFNDAEDLCDFETLHQIYDIIRTLVFSDEMKLLETLLSDKYYMLTFGAFEYDPAIGNGIRPHHREFLKNKSYYKKIVDFKEQNILNRIHQNYRITYLRDSVIGTIIDDPLTNHYNTMIYYNNMEILEHINSVPEYFDHLFENFQTNLKDSIGFLYELQTLVKNMFQMEPKIEYSSKLITKNIFSHITNSLNQLINNPENVDDPSIRNILKINLIEIMSFVIQINPNAFISYLLNNQQDSQTFVQAIVYLLKTGDQGLQIQISEILKYLLDPGLEKKVEIQDFMYDHFFPEFHKHFLMFEKNEIYYSFVQQYIEILIFCIKSHGYRIRHYIIQQKIIQDLLKGINQPEKTLSLAVIRFIKSVIIGRDEFLIKYLAQNNIFDDIFEVYFKNANKDNLIKSALLELLNLPPKENIKKLIHHLVERYKDKIIEHKLEKNFEKLFIKYDQITANENHINESEQSQNTVPVSQTQFTAVPETFENFNARELSSMEDEEYFENGEEDESKDETKKPKIIEETKVQNESNNDDKKAARDLVLNIRNKIQKKKKEEEAEDQGFPFLNKLKIKSPSVSSEKGSIGNISFDLNINSPLVDHQEEFNKRPSLTSLEDDEEISEEIKAELQKKQKI